MSWTQTLVRAIRAIDPNADLDGIAHDPETLTQILAFLLVDGDEPTTHVTSSLADNPTALSCHVCGGIAVTMTETYEGSKRAGVDIRCNVHPFTTQGA